MKKHHLINCMDNYPKSTTLANFVGSVQSHSPNTVYAVRYAHPNCSLGATSHTPQPLSVV